MKCPNCGTQTDSDDYFCPDCGRKLKEYETEDKKTSGFAKASFTLGLLGLILFFIPLLSFLAILFGIIALAKIGSNKGLTGRGLAIAGIIMGLIKWAIIFLVIKMSPKIISLLGPLLLTILNMKL